MTTNTPIDHSMVTTAVELDGYRITKSFGIVRGIVVRSRSIIGSIGVGFQTLFGGNITMLETLCETAREEAFERLCAHAAEHGANAIVGMRYDTNELFQGVTEVLAYGTAVQAEKL